jgi:hypothetical protein
VLAHRYIYERAAILEWLAAERSSPMTGKPLADRQLHFAPSRLRSAILEWQKHGSSASSAAAHALPVIMPGKAQSTPIAGPVVPWDTPAESASIGSMPHTAVPPAVQNVQKPCRKPTIAVLRHSGDGGSAFVLEPAPNALDWAAGHKRADSVERTPVVTPRSKANPDKDMQETPVSTPSPAGPPALWRIGAADLEGTPGSGTHSRQLAGLSSDCTPAISPVTVAESAHQLGKLAVASVPKDTATSSGHCVALHKADEDVEHGTAVSPQNRPRQLWCAAGAVAKWTARLHSLESLEVKERSLKGDNLAALVEALHAKVNVGGTTKLHTIRLVRTGLGPAEVSLLAGALAAGAAPLLQKLDLVGNRIGAHGAREIANALATGTLSQLTTLYLGGCNIGADGARSIANAVCAAAADGALSLKKLDLSLNDIGDAGVRSLAELLRVAVGEGVQLMSSQGSGLQLLDLRSNGISDSGAARLADALTAAGAANVNILLLSGNAIGAEGAAALATALKAGAAPVLQWLELQGNPLGGESGKQLVYDSVRSRELKVELQL